MPSQIIEENLFKEQIQRLRIDWKRLDEAMATFEEAILTVPDVFPLVPGTVLRRIQLVGFKGVPPLSIFFAVRGKNAHIVSAELINIER
jgi:hypothetical protein